jgi:hypothetical protein
VLDFIDVCFRDFKISVNVLPWASTSIINYILQTYTTQTFISKFIEKGNSQQSNNNLKIYKKAIFTHMTYIENVSNTFSRKAIN